MHRMHILLCKLRIFVVIFQPQITILEKSVITKKKNCICIYSGQTYTQVWLFRSWNSNDNRDTNENDNDNYVNDNKRTMRLGECCGDHDHKWLCFHLGGCWAKFVWTWQEKSWIQLGRTIIFLASFCKQICLTVFCLKGDSWTSFTGF